MIAPKDVVTALNKVGFEHKNIIPKNDPAYTKFTRGKECFTICFAIELEARTAADVMSDLMSN